MIGFTKRKLQFVAEGPIKTAWKAGKDLDLN